VILNSGFVDGGMNTIKKNLSRDAEKGKITKDRWIAVLGRIKPTLDLKESGDRRGHSGRSCY